MSDLKLSVLITAIDQFSAPAQKIAAVSEQLATGLHDGQKALQALGRKGQAVQRMKALETRLGRSAAEMAKATGRTAALGRELAATATPTRTLQGAFEAARRKSDALKRQHKQQRDELRQLRRELRGAGIDTRKLGDAQRQIAGDIEAATRKMQKMAQVSEEEAAAKARHGKTLQVAANTSLVAGGVERVGRGALNMLSQPIAQMRGVERSKGELASLGIEKSGVAEISQRGRELSTQLAGVTTSTFVSALIPVLEGLTPWLEKTADWMARFVDGNGAMTAALVGIVGAIGLIATVAAPALTAIASFTAAIAPPISRCRARQNSAGAPRPV